VANWPLFDSKYFFEWDSDAGASLGIAQSKTYQRLGIYTGAQRWQFQLIF
jgi:hypothetical protein